MDQLGRAAQVRVTADRTAIIGGAGSAADVEFRVTQLRAELDRADVRHRRGRAHRADRRAVRQGRRDPGRRADQRRAEGAAAPGRGRAVRHPGRDGRGHRGRRRRGAAARRARAGRPGGQRTTTRIGVEIVRRALTEPAFLIAANAGLLRARRWWPGSAQTGRRRGLRRPGRALRQHDRDGHHRPAAGRPVGAAERRVGGRPAADHEHPGRRGADALGRQPRR